LAGVDVRAGFCTNYQVVSRSSNHKKNNVLVLEKSLYDKEQKHFPKRKWGKW